MITQREIESLFESALTYIGKFIDLSEPFSGDVKQVTLNMVAIFLIFILGYKIATNFNKIISFVLIASIIGAVLAFVFGWKGMAFEG